LCSAPLRPSRAASTPLFSPSATVGNGWMAPSGIEFVELNGSLSPRPRRRTCLDHQGGVTRSPHGSPAAPGQRCPYFWKAGRFIAKKSTEPASKPVRVMCMWCGKFRAGNDAQPGLDRAHAAALYIAVGGLRPRFLTTGSARASEPIPVSTGARFLFIPHPSSWPLVQRWLKSRAQMRRPHRKATASSGPCSRYWLRSLRHGARAPGPDEPPAPPPTETPMSGYVRSGGAAPNTSMTPG
jgi:hypothetical protein